MSLEDPTPPLIIWQLCDCHDRPPLPLPRPHHTASSSSSERLLLLQFNLQISEGNIFSPDWKGNKLKGRKLSSESLINFLQLNPTATSLRECFNAPVLSPSPLSLHSYAALVLSQRTTDALSAAPVEERRAQAWVSSSSRLICPSEPL